MELGFGFTTIAIIIVVLYLLSSIKILAEYERGVIFRLGRLLPDAKGPGIILVFAPVDRMVRISLRQEALEVPPVIRFDLPLFPADVEAGVLPPHERLDGLGPDLLLPEHHREEPFPEDLLEAGEVEVLHGEVEAVLAEEAEGARRVDVRMGDQEVSEGLRRDDHGRDGDRKSRSAADRSRRSRRSFRTYLYLPAQPPPSQTANRVKPASFRPQQTARGRGGGRGGQAIVLRLYRKPLFEATMSPHRGQVPGARGRESAF